MNVVEAACPSPMPTNVILSKVCQKPPCESTQSDSNSHWIAGTWSKVSIDGLLTVLLFQSRAIDPKIQLLLLLTKNRSGSKTVIILFSNVIMPSLKCNVPKLKVWSNYGSVSKLK